MDATTSFVELESSRDRSERAQDKAAKKPSAALQEDRRTPTELPKRGTKRKHSTGSDFSEHPQLVEQSSDSRELDQSSDESLQSGNEHEDQQESQNHDDVDIQIPDIDGSDLEHSVHSEDGTDTDSNSSSEGLSGSDDDFDDDSTFDPHAWRWCIVCQRAEDWVTSRSYLENSKFSFGMWKEIVSKEGCPSCGAIKAMIQRRFGLSIFPEEEVVFDVDETSNCAMFHVYIEGNDMGRIFMNPSGLDDPYGPQGVVVDPNWIEIERLRRWLDYCDSQHGDTCHSLAKWLDVAWTGPHFLIDVENGCLVEPQPNSRYFTLSYVWGGLEGVGQTTKENVESLKKNGSMSTGIPGFTLPRTVEDAIGLVKSLGERFLWVDRLCIIQDDVESKHTEINMMGSIYANSYCTIVVADGSSAEHGIPGTIKCSKPAKPRLYESQTIIHFPSFRMVESRLIHPANGSIYSTRGWTFQEHSLSRRMLVFGDNYVDWWCQLRRWKEDVTADPEGHPSRLPEKATSCWSMTIEPWADMFQWRVLAEEYSGRSLTFDSDAKAAFAGIEEVLSPSFRGGFCYGLPEFYFDIALLWQPMQPLRRRCSIFEDPNYMPSWSFLGWEGRLLLNFHHFFEWLQVVDFGEGQFAFSETSKVQPEASWTQKGPRGQERRIENDYHIWKKDQERQQPDFHEKLGWKLSNGIWTHPVAPGTTFRYPVPLGPHEVVHTYRDWPPYLRLRSKRAFFTICKVLPRVRSFSTINVQLADETGRWAGVLHLNTDLMEEVRIDETCELVAISYGSISVEDSSGPWGCMIEVELDARPKISERYKYYNVLWIKREKTWALREAVGRIEKSVWDSQDPEDIDVELR